MLYALVCLSLFWLAAHSGMMRKWHNCTCSMGPLMQNSKMFCWSSIEMNGLGLRGGLAQCCRGSIDHVQLRRESVKELLSSASLPHFNLLLCLVHCLLSDRAPPAAHHRLHWIDTDVWPCLCSAASAIGEPFWQEYMGTAGCAQLSGSCRSLPVILCCFFPVDMAAVWNH